MVGSGREQAERQPLAVELGLQEGRTELDGEVGQSSGGDDLEHRAEFARHARVERGEHGRTPPVRADEQVGIGGSEGLARLEVDRPDRPGNAGTATGGQVGDVDAGHLTPVLDAVGSHLGSKRVEDPGPGDAVDAGHLLRPDDHAGVVLDERLLQRSELVEVPVDSQCPQRRNTVGHEDHAVAGSGRGLLRGVPLEHPHVMEAAPAAHCQRAG